MIKMWSQIVLSLLVGLAFASESPAWDQQRHYVYEVQGRSLVGLNQISSDYSGILIKAKLEIQPKSNGNLGAKLSDAKYSKVHGKLEDGWEAEIPDSQLPYQNLPLSDKPFEIVLNKGAIRNVIVSKQMTNWEANTIKSLASVIQLDTRGTNSISSSINIFTQEDEQSAVFKTMEETVTGVAETLYEIHPYPEYVLQSKPWVVPQKQLIEDGGIFEIVKSKNFTHGVHNPSYHAGLEGVSGYHPGNKVGDFLTRTSISQAVVTGSMDKFTIQSSVVYEEIVLSPDLGDEQRGAVNSKWNATLASVAQPLDQRKFEVEDPVEVGVVYRYGKPYDTDNSPRHGKEYDHGTAPNSAESSDTDSSDTERLPRSRSFKRRGDRVRRLTSRWATYADDYEEDWHQEKPTLSEAPPSPLLPFTVGYNGQSIKKQKNIPETTRQLAETIGEEFSHPRKILQEHTVGKFATLTSLIRTMNLEEVQQVASQIATETPAWIAFRDAVAQAGTGPAISVIKTWIQSNSDDEVSDYEAAEIIATAADSVRQPTEEYMKFFHEMMQDKQLMSKPYVNSSIILSFTSLIRHVYIDGGESTAKYPVHSYGSFRTARGLEFVKKTVIPYLTRKLNENINEADTQKVHVYIRALGNIGTQEILEALEPYLEGEKKASHFQRFLMIVALDQLVKSNPRVARSVLYKVYQNPSEDDQVRVAAVYQIMRTKPTAPMLQRMAAYTNVDTSNYVNAAVKSTIETAATIDIPEFHHLRTAAESAKSLLTSQEYGAQYSQGYLRGYVGEENEMNYQQYVQTFGGEDHAVPRGIRYTLQREFGGVLQNIVNMQAVTSSVEDLINVFEQQTKEYQRELQEKQQQQPEKYTWSSEYIAKLLNLQNEQREQLEGNLYWQLGAFQGISSFDNITLENLTEVVKEIENKLKQGRQDLYSKMMMGQESSLAFPTVLGLPFVYSYDRPILIRIESDVKVTAKPPVSTGESLQKPDTVQAEFDINAAASGRVHTQFGIFTPFDHTRYSAGYHKNFQLVVPLTGKLEINILKQQLQLTMQNPGNQENIRLGHYSSWPYTAQNDIYAPKPNLKIIRSSDPYKKNTIVGEKSTGIAAYLEITSDQRIDTAYIMEKLHHHDYLAIILKLWPDENIQYAHIDVGIDADKSTTDQVVLKLGYSTDYQRNEPTGSRPDPEEQVSKIPTFPEDSEKRQKEFIRRLGNYIPNVDVVVGDATVEFQGKSKIKYVGTAGASKSNVDYLGRFMAYAKKVGPRGESTTAYVQAVSKVPNTNGLNLDYAMKMDPTSQVYVQGLLDHEQRLSRADARITLSQSEERVEYLRQQDDYKECKKQMQQGNTQLPVCAQLTAEANRLDTFSMKMKYSDMDPTIINATYKTYSIVRHHLYPRVEENILEETIDSLEIEGQFSPDLEYLNASISSAYGQVELNNAPLSEWARQLLVPHPVFHVKARLEGQALQEDTYRPICVVDKTETNTFDNKTYPASFSNAWTVLLQYVPNRPSPTSEDPDLTVSEQLKQTSESYVVFAKAAQQGSSEKEIQIVLQNPDAQGKITKISMKPSKQGQGPKVLVNEQEVKYTNESSSDFYGGKIQIYALPNREVKIEIKEALYVIFNGQTLKITAVNSKFRDSSRGLCGTFNGEPETDFLGPDNCIIHDAEEFIQSYTVGPTPQKRRYIQKRGSEQPDEQCFQKKVVPANYVSNQDAGRSTDYEERGGDECTGHLSRYVEKDGEICFSIRALPFCKSACRPLHLNSKPIEVHCLEPSATTAFWRSQIDKKINQDFTMMQPTGKIQMTVPARCLP